MHNSCQLRPWVYCQNPVLGLIIFYDGQSYGK